LATDVNPRLSLVLLVVSSAVVVTWPRGARPAVGDRGWTAHRLKGSARLSAEIAAARKRWLQLGTILRHEPLATGMPPKNLNPSGRG